MPIPGSKRSILFALLLLLAAGGLLVAWGWQRPVRAEALDASLSPESGRVGTVFRGTLRCRVPWRQSLGKPRLADSEQLQMLPTGAPRLAGLGLGTRILEIPLALQAYATGDAKGLHAAAPLTGGTAEDVERLHWELPPLVVKPRPPTELGTAPTAAGALSADELAGDERRPYWPWILAGLLAGAAVIRWLWRRYEAPPPPPTPPWVRAQQALDKLRDDLPLEADAAFVRLTDILRQYIENAWNLPAPERTTPEFIRELEQRPDLFTPQQRDMLANVLELGDMVKFADREPSQSEIEEAIRETGAFIARTGEELAAAARAKAAADKAFQAATEGAEV